MHSLQSRGCTTSHLYSLKNSYVCLYLHICVFVYSKYMYIHNIHMFVITHTHFVYLCVCFRPSFKMKKGNSLWIFLLNLGRIFLSFPNISTRALFLPLCVPLAVVCYYLLPIHLCTCLLAAEICFCRFQVSLAIASNLEWNFSCELHCGQRWTSDYRRWDSTKKS